MFNKALLRTVLKVVYAVIITSLFLFAVGPVFTAAVRAQDLAPQTPTDQPVVDPVPTQDLSAQVTPEPTPELPGDPDIQQGPPAKITCLVTINDNQPYTNTKSVKLTISYDSNSVAPNQMQISDGIVTTAWIPFVTSKDWTLPGADGNKTVSCKARNSTVNTKITQGSDGILLDTRPPSGTIVINGGAPFTNTRNVNLTFTATDVAGGSNVSGVYFSENQDFSKAVFSPLPLSPYPFTLSDLDGVKNIYYQVKDNAGNFSPQYKASITLDSAIPVATISINNGAEATNSNPLPPNPPVVNLTLSGVDPGNPNNVHEMRIANDDVANLNNAPWIPYSTTFVNWKLTANQPDGVRTVFFQVRDSLLQNSLAVSDDIFLDRVAPTGSIQINDGSAFANDPTFHLTLKADDAAPSSSIDVMQISRSSTMSGAIWVAFADTTDITITDITNGNKVFYYRVKDKVGNISPIYHASILLDTKQPIITTVQINGSDLYTKTTSVTLKIIGNDENSGSGLKYICIQNDNNVFNDPASDLDCAQITGPIPATYTLPAPNNWTLSDGDGEKWVYIQLVDSAGNKSVVSSDHILLDTTLPTGTLVLKNRAGDTITADTGTTPSYGVRLAITGDGTGTPVSKMRITNEDGSGMTDWTNFAEDMDWALSDGDNGPRTVSLRLLDAAGNETAVPIPYTVLLELTPSTYTICADTVTCDFKTISAGLASVWMQNGDTVNLTDPSYTDHFTLDGDLTILANPGTVLQYGSSASTLPNASVITIDSGTVDITNLTIRFGSNTTTGGGGIVNHGTLNLTNSKVTDNNGSYGGGIFSDGSLTLVDSQISNNTGTNGGGVYQKGAGVLTIKRSFIGINTARASGGALYIDGSTVHLWNSTVGDNIALANAVHAINDSTIDLVFSSIVANKGGGLSSVGANPVALTNSMLADNTFTLTPKDCADTYITSTGDNLIETPGNCSITMTKGADILFRDPLLDPYNYNGGPTPTYELAPGSPAIDVATCIDGVTGADTVAPAFTVDQRGAGFDRPDTKCDIGPFEQIYSAEEQLLAPKGILNSRKVPFLWRADPEAEWYQLKVESLSSGLWTTYYLKWQLASNICTSEYCLVTPLKSMAGKDYRWSIRKWIPGTGMSDWYGNVGTTPVQFTVPASSTLVPLGITPKGSSDGYTKTDGTTGTSILTWADFPFQWRDFPGAVRYKIVVLRNGVIVYPKNATQSAPMEAGKICAAGHCEFKPFDPTAQITFGNYTWYVVALRSNNTTLARSMTTSFSFGPKAPTLVAPDNNPTPLAAIPAFHWKGSLDTQNFKFMVQLYSPVNGAWITVSNTTISKNASGLNPHCFVDVSGDPDVIDCIFKPSGAWKPGNYRWSVQGINAQGAKGPITTWNFTYQPATVLPVAPALVSPQTSFTLPAAGSQIFVWETVLNANKYTLQIKRGLTVLHTYLVEGCDDRIYCKYAIPDDLGMGTFTWRVQAMNTTSVKPLLSAWSLTKTFSYGPAAPTLMSPSGIQQTSKQTFQWNSVANAVSYNLLIEQQIAGNWLTYKLVKVSTLACLAEGGTKCSLSITTNLPSVPLRWTVQAYGGTMTGLYGLGSWAPRMEFRVPPVPAAPIQIAPVSPAAYDGTFTWNRVLYATDYRLKMVQGTTIRYYNAAQLISDTGASCGATTCTVTFSALTGKSLPVGTNYKWYVQAYRGLGDNVSSPWSKGAAFVITNP